MVIPSNALVTIANIWTELLVSGLNLLYFNSILPESSFFKLPQPTLLVGMVFVFLEGLGGEWNSQYSAVRFQRSACVLNFKNYF